MKKILMFLMSLFMITGCNFSTVNDEIKSINFKSYNERFQITANSNWNAVVDKGELNESADIEIYDSNNQKYFIALMESKEDITWDYKEYSDYILKQNSEIYKVEFDEIKTIKMNEYDINYVEFKTEHNSVNIYMSIYVIETENYYGQVLAWTTYSQREKAKTEFEKIVLSLKEVE